MLLFLKGYRGIFYKAFLFFNLSENGLKWNGQRSRKRSSTMYFVATNATDAKNGTRFFLSSGIQACLMFVLRSISLSYLSFLKLGACFAHK
jgi:hypothetical protein